jgi:hypothetical protein
MCVFTGSSNQLRILIGLKRFRPAIYTLVFENIAKCKVVLYYVMDGLGRYARARVQARTKKIVFRFPRMYFAVLQYIFAMYFAFNWKQACSFMN